MKAGVWAPIGSVALAAVSSACCWMPIVTIGLGLGAGGAAVMLEGYRWVFLGVASVLLGLGFHLNYRREAPCAPDGSCLPRRPLLRLINRTILWGSAILVAIFALFPELRSAISGGAPPNVEASLPESTVVLEVAGMTCAACEAPVEQALRAAHGVREAHADAASGRVTLSLDRGATPNDSLLQSRLKAVGYRLLRREPNPVAPASPRRLIRLSADGRELRDAFNHDVGSARLVALLSPT